VPFVYFVVNLFVYDYTGLRVYKRRKHGRRKIAA
jgi:hypothetical protein